MVKVQTKNIQEIQGSSVPSASTGTQNLFIDSTDKTLKTKNSSGEIVSVAGASSFAYFDTSVPSNLGVTPALSRTFTFTKSVDYIKYSGDLNGIAASRVSYLEFYKNGIKLSETKIISTSAASSNSDYIIYDRVTAKLKGVVGDTGRRYKNGFSLYINEPFEIGDKFELYLSNSSSNWSYVYAGLLEGFNNKTEDTSWIE